MAMRKKPKAKRRGPFTVTAKTFWLGTDVNGEQIVRPGFSIVFDPTDDAAWKPWPVEVIDRKKLAKRYPKRKTRGDR